MFHYEKYRNRILSSERDDREILMEEVLRNPHLTTFEKQELCRLIMRRNNGAWQE